MYGLEADLFYLIFWPNCCYKPVICHPLGQQLPTEIIPLSLNTYNGEF